jgi:hypothetical protein
MPDNAMTTLLFIGIAILGLLVIVLSPLVITLIFWAFTKLLKFEKQDFKAALLCVLIMFAIMIIIDSGFYFLFIGQMSNSMSLASLVIAGLGGIIAIHRIYKESISRCIFIVLLTQIACVIAFIFLMLLIGLILVFLKGKGVLGWMR